MARRDVRVPGPAGVRVGAGPAARAPRLRHRLRLSGDLRVRGPPPDRPPRLARPRRPAPGSSLGLGRGAHDDPRLLPLRVHTRASRARGAGAGVPRDRAGARALADGDPVRRHPAPGTPRSRRRDSPGLHGGAGGLRHGRDIQLPHADRGDLPRVARDVRSRRGDPARRDPPRTGGQPPGARAPLARTRPVYACPSSGAPARAAPTHRDPGARRHPLLRRHARPRLRAAGGPAHRLGPRGGRTGQRARGVPPGPRPEPDARRRRRHPGHGGGRPPRVRDPASADAARGFGHAPGGPRVCAPGRGHCGGRPSPAREARPDAGDGTRASDRCHAGPPPDGLGGGPPLRLPRPVPGGRQSERRGESHADSAKPRRGGPLARRRRRPDAPRDPPPAGAPRAPRGGHARLRRRDEGAARHAAPPAVRPGDAGGRHLAADGGVLVGRGGRTGPRARPGRPRARRARDAGQRRRGPGHGPPNGANGRAGPPA